MKQVILEGVQNPVEEITSKISNYFRSHGFKQEGQFDKFATDGDFGIEVSGTIDDIHVQVCYQDEELDDTLFTRGYDLNAVMAQMVAEIIRVKDFEWIELV